MKIRLALFVGLLLTLPYLGLLLSGGEWSELNIGASSNSDLLPAVFALLVITAIFLFSNLLLGARNGQDPLRSQRGYFLTAALSGTALGWLLTYLNHFNPVWLGDGQRDAAHLILYSLIFATLPLAILGLRALLGSFSAMLKRLANAPKFPVPTVNTVAFTLAPLALLGLLSGAVWPSQLFWLFWLSPLLLLVGLQLFWNESTVFDGLAQGDWGRVICALAAGLITGNFAMLAFDLTGGELQLELYQPTYIQLGFAAYGLLVLQLGDAIAEAWRGKKRGEVFRKKTFPIPVVVKK